MEHRDAAKVLSWTMVVVLVLSYVLLGLRLTAGLDICKGKIP